MQHASKRGLDVAIIPEQAIEAGKETSMSRVSKYPRKCSSHRRQTEERPVLQLPLQAPAWREPPAQESAKPESERGVVVVDFFI